jgi:tight adherence protein C
MSPVEFLLLGALGAGAALLFDQGRWFRQGPLAERLRVYGPPGPGPNAAPPRRSTAASVLVPLVQQAGDRLSRTLGVTTDLGTRLERAGVDTDAAGFRLRQVLHGLAGIAVGAGMALLVRPGVPVSVLLVAGCPVVWILADEQRLDTRANARRRRLQLELPVIAEQLAILIDAGSSLPAALARISRRTHGIAADDLGRVTQRIRQGLPSSDALQEWADRRDLDSLRRLVGMLALHREAGDLGRLVAAEARAIRAESHRSLVERIERRSQLVWVPVTVATLVPGLLFLAVPFVSALSRVTGT